MADPTYALPGNQGSIIPQNGSVGTPLPTSTSISAPAASPVTPAAPSTTTSSPTAVVSSGQATDYINNTIKPTLDAAKTAQTTQQSTALAAAMANPYAKQPGEDIPTYNARVAAYNASKAPAPVPEKTPEQQIADTPDTGNQWVYDAQGNKSQVPIGTLPVGFSTTNPHTGPTTPVADTTTDSVGNVYKQFSDGTYGKYNAMGVYMQAASPTEFQASKNGESLLNSLNQLANGTFPLSTNEQAQVDGLKASFLALIKQQETANANYTGGVTVAENLYGMGTSISGLGEIKGSIDAGIAKIADINSQMSSAVAKMEAGFRADDIAATKAAYDAYTGLVKSKQDELDKQVAAAKQAVLDGETAARENERLKLEKMMDDNTISYQAKQLALSQSTLDEKTKDDLEKNQIERLKLALDVRKQNYTEAHSGTQPLLNGASIPSVPITDGRPDASAQRAFLDTVPGGPGGMLATQIKGLANYDLSPTDFTVRTTKGSVQIDRATMVAYAKMFDPTYDDQQFAARQAYVKSLASNSPSSIGSAINSANKSLVHLTNYITTMDTVDNKAIHPANAAVNAFALGKRQENLSKANMEGTAVGDELAKFLKGTGTTDVGSVEAMRSKLGANNTPAEVKGNAQGAIDLLTGQIGVLQEQYTRTMGKTPESITGLIGPTAAANLSKLKDQGYTVDIPGINYTNKDSWQTHGGGTQEQWNTAVDRLTQAGLPLTQDNILQMAQSLDQ